MLEEKPFHSTGMKAVGRIKKKKNILTVNLNFFLEAIGEKKKLRLLGTMCFAREKVLWRE